MNNESSLMKNLIYSFLLLTSATSFGQKMSKLVQTNENNRTFQYETTDVYARGLYWENDRLFISNSDGGIYYYNTKTNKSKLVFKMNHIDEMRDVVEVGDYVLGMHSGEDGKLAKVGFDGSFEIIEQPEWKGVFLDGFDFIGKQGFMMGDPTNGKFNLFHTNDGGLNWERCPGILEAKEGEAGFAASGTNVQMINPNTYVFVSGGSVSYFYRSNDNGKTWMKIILPYYPGESSGGFSICFSDEKTGVIVGGDYLTPELKMNTCFFTEDGGESWFNAETTVGGYRSCVIHKNGVFYACGPNGIDYSTNKGVDWKPFANGAFFSLTSTPTQLIASAKNGTLEFFELIKKK